MLKLADFSKRERFALLCVFCIAVSSGHVLAKVIHATDLTAEKAIRAFTY